MKKNKQDMTKMNKNVDSVKLEIRCQVLALCEIAVEHAATILFNLEELYEIYVDEMRKDGIAPVNHDIYIELFFETYEEMMTEADKYAGGHINDITWHRTAKKGINYDK